MEEEIKTNDIGSYNKSISDLEKFSSIPEIPKCLRVPTVMKYLSSYSDSEEKNNYRRGAHVLLWAPCPGENLGGTLRAAVMMHVRFDGTFGFPGGLIDEGEDVLCGLNRELSEEIGWSTEYPSITWDDYFTTMVFDSKKLVLDFFTKQLTINQYIQLEKDCLTAPEYGQEVFGTIRVPLYTMIDHYGGFPAFLNHKFVGNAKQMLLVGLIHCHIFSEDEIEEIIYKANSMKLAPCRM